MEKQDAFGYCRVSGDSQADGDGFDRQREAITGYCKSSRYQIAEYFEDVITGTGDAVDRPAFADMCKATNGTQTVIIERLDRLARTVVAQEHTVLWMASKNIELIVADSGENITEAYRADPMRRALIQMQGVFAELDKSMTAKKLLTARQHTKKKQGHISKAGHLLPDGKCEGAKAYGELDPDEMETVKRIKVLGRKRGKNKLSLRKIAAVLDSEMRPTRSGGKWSAQMVKNVLDRKLDKVNVKG